MAIVLASPGTPSTSRWPRASSATIIRSSSSVLPDDGLLDLVQRLLERVRPRLRRAAVGSNVAPWASWSSVAVTVDGRAGGTAGRGDGDGEADADEEALLAGVGEGGDDADDLAGPVEQRAAGVAGVHRGVELDEPARASGRCRCRSVRSSADTTPAVSESRRPSGLPDRRTRRRPPGAPPPSTAGTTTSGRRSGARTAMSLSGCRLTTLRGRPVPSANRTSIRLAAGDDVQGREDLAPGVDDHTGAELGVGTGGT